MNQSVFKFAIGLSVLAIATTAMAAQTIHYFEDFTDGALNDDLAGVSIFDPGTYTGWGGVFPNYANLALQSQEAWRNPGQTYYGPTQATAFDANTGFGGANIVAFAANITNSPVLQSGNVWVFDVTMISDMAVTSGGGGFFASGPGPVIEWNFADHNIVRPTGFDESAVSQLLPSVAQNVLSTSYTTGGGNGIDNQAASEPNALPATLSDAALPARLDGLLRSKFVYQKIDATDSTRANTQVFAADGTTPLASFGKNVEGPGRFRDDYTGQLLVQIANNHGNGNVTYSAGRIAAGGVAGDGRDEVYDNTTTDLELGLTSMTFKQVRAADSNTDGVVNGGGDVPIWGANFGGSGKSFFEGDSNGDGLVNGAGDVPIWGSQFGTDVMAPGGILVEYTPSTGNVKVSMNNISSLRLISDDGLLIVANVPATIPGSAFHDPTTVNETNYGGFPLTAQDDFGMGMILPVGLATPAEQFVAANKFRVLYTVLGGGQTNIPLQVVNTEFVIPEPSSFALLGLAGVGLVRVARRRRRLVA